MGEAKPDLVQQWDTALKDSRFEDPVSAARAFAQKMVAKAEMISTGDPNIHAVLDFAEAFAAAERFHEVLAFVEPVLGPMPASGRGDGEVLSQALLIQGRALSALGRLQEAVSAFDQCAKACAEEDFEGSARRCACALLSKAGLIVELAGGLESLMKQAITEYEELEQGFEHHEESAVRSLVAQAHYNHANVLGDLGRAHEAASQFGKALEAADGLASNALPPRFEAFTRLRQRRLIAVDIPQAAAAARVLRVEVNNVRLQEEFARRQAWRCVLTAPHRVMWWRRKAALKAAELLEDRIQLGVAEQLAVLKHERACTILCATQSYLEPFILMLRNFDYNSFTRAIPFPPNWNKKADPLMAPLSEITLGGSQLVSRGSFEANLATSLSRFAPVIGVANASNWRMETEFQFELPTLYLAEDQWMDAVRGLIDVADVILVRLAFMTPGVTEELAYIEQVGARDKTILVVPEASEIEGWKSLIDVLAGSTAESFLPWPEADTEALSSHFRVVMDSEVLLGQPGYSTPLATEIAKINKIKEMTFKQRLEYFSTELGLGTRQGSS